MTRATGVQTAVPAGHSPGAYRLAAQQVPQRAGVAAPQHYSRDAMVAMSVLGIMAIAGCVLFALVCGALLRYITGRKRRRGVSVERIAPRSLYVLWDTQEEVSRGNEFMTPLEAEVRNDALRHQGLPSRWVADSQWENG